MRFLKLPIFLVRGDERVIRSCGYEEKYSSDGEKRECYNTVLEEYNTYVCTCEGDGCNGSANIKFSIFSIVNLENEFKVWIFWWEAVIELNQSFPLGLLAMKAKTWASLMQHSKTVDELVHLPGSQRRVFTESNETTGTWEIDQSITTSAILK